MHAIVGIVFVWIRKTAQGISATAQKGIKETLTSLMDAQMSMNASRIQVHAQRVKLVAIQ